MGVTHGQTKRCVISKKPCVSNKSADRGGNPGRVRGQNRDCAQYCDTREIAARDYAVLRVIDGDTFTVMYDGEETSVRLADFDAPEPNEPGGPAAPAALKKLIGGKIVRLDFPGKRKRDGFGRLLATITVDGRDVGEALKGQDFERRSRTR